MQNNYPLNYDYESNSNTKLYEFLATHYDISVLANKISAAKYAQISLMNLKKMSNPSQ